MRSLRSVCRTPNFWRFGPGKKLPSFSGLVGGAQGVCVFLFSFRSVSFYLLEVFFFLGWLF